MILFVKPILTWSVLIPGGLIAAVPARNVGWRIDYATVADELADQVTGVAIHPDITGSDHCPVTIDIDVE